MKRMNLRKRYKKSTMNKIIFVVFFCVIINSIIIFNLYSKGLKDSSSLLISEKLDKIIYQFFSDLITDDVINENTVNDILVITKNNNDEILTVNYDMEKTYAILTNVSNILKKGLSDLEKGKIDVSIYDKYISNKKDNLILYIPLFLGSDNIYLTNLGPKIPIAINFSETLLTNIKTKVTNYGFNNALLEVYITVEMQELIITPVIKKNDKFNYDILIGALVVNGNIPEFYGNTYESVSAILDIPLKQSL